MNALSDGSVSFVLDPGFLDAGKERGRALQRGPPRAYVVMLAGLTDAVLPSPKKGWVSIGCGCAVYTPKFVGLSVCRRLLSDRVFIVRYVCCLSGNDVGCFCSVSGRAYAT